MLHLGFCPCIVQIDIYKKIDVSSQKICSVSSGVKSLVAIDISIELYLNINNQNYGMHDYCCSIKDVSFYSFFDSK